MSLMMDKLDISWKDAEDYIIQDDKDKYDIDYVGNEHMVMNEDTELISIRGKDPNFSLTKNAAKQVCRHFNIPFDFWMKELDHYDRAYIFNKFCKTRNAEFFVRCRNNGDKSHGIRGFLSHLFVPLDNRFIIEQLESFRDKGDYKITNFFLDDNRLHFRVIDPSIVLDLTNGKPDLLYGGIHIANSETGTRNATIDAVVYRQICKNGMMGLSKDSFLNITHRGQPEADFVMGYKDAVRDALKYSGLAFDKIIKTQSMDLEHNNQAESLIDGLDSLKASKTFKDEVVKEFENSEHSNLYDFVNVLTHQAQKTEWDKRCLIERHAGSLLKLAA